MSGCGFVFLSADRRQVKILTTYAMEYNRDAVLALFERRLRDAGFRMPDGPDSLGSVFRRNTDFRLLASFDDKSLVIAASFDWLFDDYDFDDIPDGAVGDNVRFEYDEDEQIIRFVVAVNFADIDEDSVVMAVIGGVDAICQVYDCLYIDAYEMEQGEGLA